MRQAEAKPVSVAPKAKKKPPKPLKTKKLSMSKALVPVVSVNDISPV